MGLATTATHAIWLIAILGAGAVATTTYFDVAEELTEARELREAQVDERVDTELEYGLFCWDGSRVRVTASNVGRSTIDTLNVSVLVDGVAEQGFTATLEAGPFTAFWAPGYNATLKKTGFAAEPDRVVLVTAEGIRLYPQRYTCPTLNVIYVTPGEASMDIGETRTFTASGYDQFGRPYDPDPYLWSSTCGTVVGADATAQFTAGTVSGPCTLRVTSEEVEGTAVITIDPDPPASMVVSPDPRGVPAGGTAAFTATVYDQYGNVNGTSAVTWSTNAGSIDAAGVLTAQTTAQMGRGVTATTTHGVSETAVVDVYAAQPQAAVVSPDPKDVTVGATQAFTVVLTDAYGNVNSTAPVTWTTDAGSIDASGLLTAQTTAEDGLSVTATSGAAAGSATVNVKPGPPDTIVVSPDPTTVSAGATRAFTATVYDSYGNVNTTAIVVWTTNAGSIDASGLLTAQTTAQDDRTVTATSEAASDTATVDVWPAAPATAVVSPDPVGVAAGSTRAFAVTLYDQYGNENTTAPVTWSTNAGSIDAAGVLTAQTTAQSGRSVTATSGAATDSATVDVVAAAPASALVVPDGAGVTVGTTRQYTATLYDQYGNVNSTASVAWTTNAGAIDAAGLLTAQTTAATGRTVTATHGAVADSATVDVIADAPTSVTVSPGVAGVPAGGQATFSATLYDQYGNVNATAPTTWTTTAGSISAGGVLTAQTTAQMGRSVTATTTGSVSASATVDVYAAAPAAAAVSPDPKDVTVGATQAFAVVLTDAYGNVNSTAPVTWTTNAGAISAAGLLTAQTVAADGRSVTATSGAVSDSATVHVKPGPPASIVVSPDPTTVSAGATRAFTATVYDSYGNVNTTSIVTWSTNAGSIDASGLLTAQTTPQNGRSVTATSGAASDTATIDVWPAAPASVTVVPEGAGVTAGTTRQYTATLYDQYGNVNSTATVTWSTNAGSISAGGLLTAQTTAATGRTVTATSGAASGSATVDVWAAQPASVTVLPQGAGVTVGTTRQYTATLYDQYGNVNSTASVTWSTNAGSVSSGGLLTAQTTAATGRSVTATSGSASGSATVDLIAAAPSTATVSPDVAGVAAGSQRTFTATLRDAYGNVNATATVTWTTTAGSLTSGGVLTAQTTAQTGRSVTATSGAASGSATVDVYAAAPDRITVSPSSATVFLNLTQQLSATVYDAYNNVNSTSPVAWSATSGSVSGTGLYTAPSTGGSVTVTASSGGRSGTATVTVVREVHVDAMATYKNGVAASSFRKGQDTVEVRTTVRDHANNLVLGGASVTIEFVNPDGVVVHTASGTTDGAGIASVSYALPQNAKIGANWVARVTTIGGTHLQYNSALNVVSSVTFAVTAN